MGMSRSTLRRIMKNGSNLSPFTTEVNKNLTEELKIQCWASLRKNIRILSYSSPNAGKCGLEQLRIRTLLMQSILMEFDI